MFEKARFYLLFSIFWDNLHRRLMSIPAMAFCISNAEKRVIEMRLFLQKSLQKVIPKSVGFGHAACLAFQRDTLSWSTQRVALTFPAR